MSNKENLELAHWAIKQAKSAGADEASVNINKSRSVEVDFYDRKIDKLFESTENSLSINIYADKKYSGHSTNDLRKETLGKFISEAVAMTKYLGQDPFRSLPDPKYYEGQKNVDLKVYDDSYGNLTTEERVKLARDLEDATLGQSDQIVSCSSGYSDSISESVKVHSNGFEGQRESTYYSYGVEATLKDPNGGRPSDWAWSTGRFRNGLSGIEPMANLCIERAKQKIGQTKMESGKYDMLIENRTASRLIGALTGAMRGRSLQQKNSFLEGKLGEKIASEKLTMIDDPFIISGLGSQLYDGEGMATKRRVFIDKGVLKSYYIDVYYGKKLGMEPTIGGSTNTVFEYGDKSLEDMIKLVNKGILVTSFVGGNSNSTTGDFSYGIIGMYIENGKLVKPVNEMNVSGNSGEIWMALDEVGNDPYMDSSMRRPSLLFRDIQFSGI